MRDRIITFLHIIITPTIRVALILENDVFQVEYVVVKFLDISPKERND